MCVSFTKMNILNDLYHKSVAKNEKNLRFWEDYLKNLQSLDFSVYVDKLKIPTLVPVGNRILFRGELKHTNEVTVSLGADYFVKCSINQAEILKQHRIKDAKWKVETYKKEKEYLERQVLFNKQNFYENQGHEIVEVYSEEEDKAWRMKHRENMRIYKQKERKEEQTPKEEITDEDLWNRLEELEMQEELENELLDLDDHRDFIHNEKPESVVVNEGFTNLKNETDLNEKKDNITFKEANKTPIHTKKLDLLQKVIDKQKELENKLYELKNKNRNISKTENDLITKMDEMEQLDELEDEMDRLDDILETEAIEEVNEEYIAIKSESTKLKRRVSFADEEDSETIEITFKHTNTEPSNVPYNPEKGIVKPSDIYESYSNLFGTETASILKKPKYESILMAKVNKSEVQKKFKTVQFTETEQEDLSVNRTIVVEDVVEKIETKDNQFAENTRPISLFRKRRIQNKS